MKWDNIWGSAKIQLTDIYITVQILSKYYLIGNK